MAISIAENVDEKGILKIRSLISRYGLEEFLQAVLLEMGDITDSVEKDEKDYQIAVKVQNSLDRMSVGARSNVSRAPVRSWSAPGAHGVGGSGRGSPFHLWYPKSPTILILWIIVTPIKLMPSVRMRTESWFIWKMRS